MEKEVKKRFCDVCPEFKLNNMDNEARYKCFICGIDLCYLHAVVYYRAAGNQTYDKERGKIIVFCWDHDPEKKVVENAENQD